MDRQTIRGIWLTGIVALALSVPAPADVIVLKNGREIRSERVWEEGSDVLCNMRGGVLRFPKSLVLRIDREGKRPDGKPDAPAPVTLKPVYAKVFANDKEIEKLVAGAGGGDVAGVTALLDRGLDINGCYKQVSTVPSSPGSVPVPAAKATDTPLMAAAQAGRTDMVRLLLSRGAKPDIRHPDHGYTALSQAAGAGHADIVRILLDLHPDTEAVGNALILASGKNRTDVMEMLIAYGVRAEDLNRAMRAAETGGPEAAQTLRRHGGRNIREELDEAARNGNLGLVRELILLADPAEIAEALDSASAAGQAACGLALAEQLQKVNRTALNSAYERALLSGNPSIADMILPLCPGPIDNNVLMLHAAEAGKAQSLEYLLSHGASINAADSVKQTPLILAARNGHLEAVTFLLANGADRTPRDQWHRSALDWAKAKGYKQITALLE